MNINDLYTVMCRADLKGIGAEQFNEFSSAIDVACQDSDDPNKSISAESIPVKVREKMYDAFVANYVKYEDDQTNPYTVLKQEVNSENFEGEFSIKGLGFSKENFNRDDPTKMTIDKMMIAATFGEENLLKIFNNLRVTAENGTVEIKYGYDAVQTNQEIDASGEPTAGDITSLAKASFTESFLKDYNKIIPVKNGNTGTYFSPDNTVAVTPRSVAYSQDGKDSGGLAFGKSMNIIALDYVGSDKKVDKTDILSKNIKLKNIYIQIGKSSITTSDKIYYKASGISMFHKAKFTKSPNGDDNDMVLTFNSDLIKVNAGSYDFNGSATVANKITSLSTLNSTSYAYFSVNITGEANLNNGTIKLVGNEIKLHSVYDNGVKLDSSNSTYTAWTTATGTLKLDSYDLDINRANTNIKDSNLEITRVNKHFPVTVGPNSGIFHREPLGDNPKQNIDVISSSATALKQRLAGETVAAMVNFFDDLGGLVSSNDLITHDTIQLAPLNIMDGYRKGVAITDLPTTLTNRRSTEYREDLATALRNRIESYLSAAVTASGLRHAQRITRGGRGNTIGFQIVTSETILNILNVKDGGTLNLGKDFEVRVTETNNPLLDDMIYVLARDWTNAEANKFSFFDTAITVTRPDTAISGNFTRNGGTTEQYMLFPYYNFELTYPFMLRIEVTNSEDLLKQ